LTAEYAIAINMVSRDRGGLTAAHPVSGLAALALAQTCLQLLLPALSASPRALATARKLIVSEDRVSDYDYLVAKLDWTGESVRSVLQHVELAGLQRRMFYSDLPKDYFLKYVLWPDVGGQGSGNWGWRRILWEAFYPRVRKEVTPAAAAEIVVRFLRERVTVDPSYIEVDVPTIAWQRGRTSDAGFQRLYIAALRSTGIAARLGENLRAQLWDGETWVPAPQPLFREELPRREATAQP